MLPSVAKKPVEKRKNPNPNQNLNQQPEEIAINNFENVCQRNVKGKRTVGNVQTELQTNAKKPVERSKIPNLNPNQNQNQNPNPNLNQQPEEIARRNVFQINVNGKRIVGNV